MPPIDFHSGINLQKTGRIHEGGWESLPTAPSNPFEGQEYYDSTLKKVGTYNGTSWDYTNSQVVNNSTITIQKNGTDVESFTLNQGSNEIINITVPTQASDVGALPDTTTINDLTSTAQQNALNSGITSALVTQIGTNQTNITNIQGVIPSDATSSNKLTSQQYVDDQISTNSASFDGSWATYSAIPSTVAGFTNEGLPEPTNNNYLVVLEDEVQTGGGTWRYKYVDDSGSYDKDNWQAEYQVNETPFTQAQLDAINSGMTSALVAQIGTNQTNIGTLQTAMATKAEIFTATNPALSLSGTSGVCQWALANPIGTKYVNCQFFNESTGAKIETYWTATAQLITASFNSTENISAGTFRIVATGLLPTS